MLQKLIVRFRSLRRGQDLGRFVVFLLVGLLNTVFGYGCFAVFVYLGLHYGLAALLSTVLGVLFNFRTIGSIVFRSRDNRLLGRFVGFYVVVYAVNLLGLRLLVGLGPYLAGAVLLLPLAFLSYYLQGRFVFPAGAGSDRD